MPREHSERELLGVKSDQKPVEGRSYKKKDNLGPDSNHINYSPVKIFVQNYYELAH